MDHFKQQFYNNELMYSFTKYLKTYYSNLHIDEEILLKNFLNHPEKRKTLNRRHWNFFRKTCKNLTEIGNYSAILRFMFAVFNYGNTYDLQRMKEELSKIKVVDDKNLAEMCSEFYLYVRKESDFSDDDIPVEMDVYSGDGYSDFLWFETQDFTKFIVQYIFKESIDPYHLQLNDINRIYQKAIDVKRKSILENENHIKQVNNKRKAIDDQYNLDTPKLAMTHYKEFERELYMLGFILDLFKVAELNGQNDLAYDIQHKYLWPFFANVPWKEPHRITVQNIAIMFRS